MHTRTTKWLSLSFLLVAAACGDHPLQGFGLEQRETVQGLQFPTGLPQPSALQPVVAFPSLQFNLPVLFTAVPDNTNRVVVVQQDGLVRIFTNDPAVGTAATYLDISGRILFGGEEGLLGFAFHPDYANNGWFYVYYSMQGPRRSVVSRFRVQAGNANAADMTSEVILLQFDQPFSNHNAGSLCFGPDGMLYIASGDGGSGNDPFNNAQNLTNLLGKILRLQSDGSIPLDNPFVGGSNGERGEIWCYGMRNPWRTSFDRATGELWCGDVGQGSFEEVDIIVRGANYGWRMYEGNQSNINPANVPASSFTAPVWDYPRGEGNCVIGGYVYRGPGLPGMVGAYIYGDLGSGRIWALVYANGQAVSNTQVATLSSPASFGEDATGELYVCSFDGNIYKFAPSAGGSSVIPATLSATGLFTDLAALTPTAGLIEYDVQSELHADGARKRRFMALPGQARITFAATAAWTFPVGTVLVKHFEIDVPSGPAMRLETRVLMHRTTGWQGFTYRWNAGGTDADLLQVGGDVTFTAQPMGHAPRQQTWHFPSEAECYQCHTGASGRVLGINTGQLNRSFMFTVRSDNQLRAWNHIGLFSTDVGSAAQYEMLPDPTDMAAPLAARARAWLAANCAQCHRPQGGSPVDLDLRYDATDWRAVGIASTVPVGGAPSGTRITAGSKELSDLWLRIGRRDQYGMPPLGSNVVDDAAVALIGAWIDGGAGR